MMPRNLCFLIGAAGIGSYLSPYYMHYCILELKSIIANSVLFDGNCRRCVKFDGLLLMKHAMGSAINNIKCVRNIRLSISVSDDNEHIVKGV
jgi:hypothetical protein